MDKLFFGPAKKQEHASSKTWGRNVEIATFGLQELLNYIWTLEWIGSRKCSLFTKSTTFYDLGKTYLTVEMMTTLLSCPWSSSVDPTVTSVNLMKVQSSVLLWKTLKKCQMKNQIPKSFEKCQTGKIWRWIIPVCSTVKVKSKSKCIVVRHFWWFPPTQLSPVWPYITIWRNFGDFAAKKFLKGKVQVNWPKSYRLYGDFRPDPSGHSHTVGHSHLTGVRWNFLFMCSRIFWTCRR